MLASIPSFLLRQAPTLGYSYGDHANPAGEDSATQNRSSSLNANSMRPSSSGRRHLERHNRVMQSSLTTLIADEEAIETRKANIRRFGSTWIRPPGIAKTYQATMDEALERAEQEAIARREAAMMEQTAAAEAAARAQTQGATGGRRVPADFDLAVLGAEGAMDLDVEVEGDGLLGQEDQQPDDMERDLDEGVPEADDFAFDEGSAIGDDEHNLDDDVPEAGSYQHTDTEVEDESSDEDLPQRRQAAQDVEIQSGQDMQSESSATSSPITARGPRRDRENFNSRRPTPGR